ncbi:response regulator [Aureimonas endophytica]|uniref:Response regulator n=1 Tax=Aureimonas endophytica TaxID=2027858 RepID=A0A916ZFQ8_9HYPH|nr:response regulator [Aureimonas endophytica]GGD92538.1 response regulator [Aureimonas endophytica]
MRAEEEGRGEEGRDLAGLKVFAVEDESLVAMQLEDMLYEFGCEVVGLAMRVARALDMADTLPAIDFAVLDVNIAGDKVYPVAACLRARGVPIVFATGYGRAGVDPEWHECQIVQKPYTADELRAHIEGALRSGRAPAIA